MGLFSRERGKHPKRSSNCQFARPGLSFKACFVFLFSRFFSLHIPFQPDKMVSTSRGQRLTKSGHKATVATRQPRSLTPHLRDLTKGMVNNKLGLLIK